MLCTLASHDVYTLLQERKKAPTKFCFAMKSQDRLGTFEDSKEYVRYLCVEQPEKMKDWVLSIRNAKVFIRTPGLDFMTLVRVKKF